MVWAMKLFYFISRQVVFFLLPIFLITCATTNLTPLSFNPEARLESDERRIWLRSEEEQRKLDKSRKILNDPLFEEYLNDMGTRLTPKSMRGSERLTFRFKIIRDTALNAFAYPNGKIYVHSGLIARVDNEAQLATILAHEMVHSINRHAVRGIRDQQNKRWWYVGGVITLSILTAYLTGKRLKRGDLVGASLLNNTARILVALGLPLAIMASINGHSRSLETEADKGGMRLLANADYAVDEAPEVFALFQKTYGDNTATENFFFGSHPRNGERIENYQAMLAGSYSRIAQSAGRTRDTQTFQLRRRVIVRENAYADIRAGRFNVARSALDKVLAITPNDPKSHYYYGMFYKLSEKTRECEEKALRRFEKALELDSSLFLVYREMGLLYIKRGEKKKARQAFLQYLKRAPTAKDRDQIKDYLVELGG